MTVRRLTAEDIPAVAALEKRCFSDPWHPDTFGGTFASSVSVPLGAFGEEGLVGFIIGISIPPECEIADLAVDPAARRHGIARTLVEALFSECDPGVCYLEVRESNRPARALYEALGFSPCGVRKKYYANPVEDAIVMRLDFAESKEL